MYAQQMPGYMAQMQMQNGAAFGQRPMIPARAPTPIKTIYSQKTTKNKSFLEMHYFLKSIGIKNNEFMLALIDPDLDGIDPYDPNLNGIYKQKVLREVMTNYWYFLREVVRLPSAGAAPMRYKLDRSNLAYNFCASLNLNIFLEAPRLTINPIIEVIQ